MTDINDIERAIERLPAGGQLAIADWLQELLDTRYRGYQVAELRSIGLALPLRQIYGDVLQ